MHAGHVISGAGHLGLIGWLLFSGLFQPAPQEVEFTPVSIISSEEFAALQNPQEAQPEEPAPQAPDAMTDLPEQEAPAPEPEPEPTPEPPTQSVTPRPRPEQPQPEEPVADATPPAPEPVPEPPAPESEEQAAVPPQPEPVPAPVRPDAEPTPQDAPRVSPEPVAPREEDLPVDDVAREEVAPSDEPAEVVEEEQDAAAPEDSTTRIVTEADEPAAAPPPRAPEQSVRPKTRPERPAPQPEPEPEPDTQTAAAQPEPEPEPAPEPEATPDPEPAPEPEEDNQQDLIDQALAEALGGSGTSPEPQVQPLTAGEMNVMRLSVEACWKVDPGSASAQVTVTLAFSMDRNGRVQPNSIEMVASEGGEPSAARAAFLDARRAVLACENGGYPLPAEKYDQWKTIEMTFNPENMRNL